MYLHVYLCTRRYPVRVEDGESEDPRSVMEYSRAICEEIKKLKPKDSLLLLLMIKMTQDRRIVIQSDTSAVSDILEHYPAFG